MRMAAFSMIRWGFGEICTKLTQLVDVLCDYMASGCAMKDMYRKRADDFFAYKRSP